MPPRPRPVPRVDDRLPALLAAVAAGDADAFEAVHHATHAFVLGVASRALRQPDLAAEVVQEVFLHVWLHASTYDPARGNVHAWLGMQAHRRAVDRLRSVVRAAARDQRDAAERAAAGEEDVAELGTSRCEAARLRAALSQISAGQREAVVLAFLHGYSHAEVAVLLGVPLGTVKTRVRNGLIGLRRHVGLQVAV